MKNLRSSSNQRVHALEAKFAACIESEALPLEEEDECDLVSVIKEVEPMVEQRFPSDSPQRIFWAQQTKYNQLKQYNTSHASTYL